MSIYDKASLVQIPSGVKSGTLYNVVPNTADGDFDFTRGSTATRVNKDGLIETVSIGVPRLDYPLLDGVVQDCPALLLEPQRRNDIPYSDDINSWASKTFTTVSSNNVISPDGTQNADKLTSTANFARITEFLSLSSSTTYTISFYVKNISAVNPRVSIFDTTNGVSLNSTYYGSLLSTTEWKRLEYQFTTTTAASVNIEPVRDLNNAEEMYIWGIQLEAGSYATSYIPTSGQPLGVTRSADVCNGAQADFNDSEGVLFADIAALADDGTVRRIAMSNSSASSLNRIELNSTTNRVFAVTYTGGSNQAALFFDLPDTTTPFKVAYKYKQNDFALWVDGFEVSTDTSGITPTALVKLNFDNGAGGNDFYGKTKQLMTFNEALSDTELENLTSWDSFREMATEQLYTIE